MALTGLYVMPVDFLDWYHEFVQPGEDEEPQVLPRCCLCCFKFEQCDSIVVFNSRNPHLLDTWAGEYIEPERIEPTGWDFAKGRRPLEKGYHSECVHMVAKSLPFADSIHCAIRDRTSYGVGYTELLPSVEAARVRRLKKRFAQELMAIVGYRLPLEICENIGRYCLSDKTPPGCLATSGFWSQLRQAPVNHSYEQERHEDFGGRAQFLVKDAEVTSGRHHYLLPPVSWTKRRTRWTKESIAADLRQAINGGLPEEICQYIASFCMRERACLILRELWLDPNRPNCWIKSLFIGRNNSIWAKNMEVEGLRYVRSLSTRRLTQQDALVFKTRYRKRGARNRPEACLNIYYSEDHGGIREVIITEDHELPSLNMEPVSLGAFLVIKTLYFNSYYGMM
ncbi:uncharacterized protein FRV6_03113 [Fusarium oxysporum]|uniref:Uncharacterized protein n=1 Tax=Fusarium oxysporum TaxID=5507 RepID=A0A2H3T7K5_FUSOX|nr:uncharacterized protein FRV6_03113 [Fusarium oxysporum]